MVGRESLGDLHRPFGIELQTPISIVCGGGVPEPIENRAKTRSRERVEGFTRRGIGLNASRPG